METLRNIQLIDENDYSIGTNDTGISITRFSKVDKKLYV